MCVWGGGGGRGSRGEMAGLGGRGTGGGGEDEGGGGGSVKRFWALRAMAIHPSFTHGSGITEV